MRLIRATVLTTALATAAIAQSEVPNVPGVAFSGFRTYWVQKRDGCRPVIAFNVRNTSDRDIGAIEFRMEVVDNDKNALFAGGMASVPAGELPPGHSRDLAIGGDHDITAHDCLGDMHETAFSGIHFVVRLSAKSGHDAASVEIVRNEPMTEALVASQD